MKKNLLFLLAGFVLLTASFAVYGQTPLITSPSTGTTVSPCGFNVAVSQINPPPSDGRFYRVKVQYKKIAQPLTAYTSNFVDAPIDGSDENFGPYNVFIPSSGTLRGDTIYNVRARYQVFDENTEQWVFYGSISSVINVTTSTAVLNPVITSPTSNATGVSVTPTINVAAYAGCGNLTNTTIEIAPTPVADTDAAWASALGKQTSPAFPSSNGPFSWTPPTPLSSNTQYRIRVRFTNNWGPIVYTSYSNFTTGSGITATITSPTNNATGLSVCNIPVQVAPITPAPGDGKNYRLRVRYRNFTIGEAYSNTRAVYEPIDGSSSNFGPYTVSIPVTGTLLANTSYDIEARYEVDSDGNGTWSNYGQTQTIRITTGAGDNTSPVVTAPINGATGVSINPTIQVAAYTGCVPLSSATIEIDRGSASSPADWVNPDYQSITFNGNNAFSWTPGTALDNNADYQVRVTYNKATGSPVVTIINFKTERRRPLLVSPITQFNNRFNLCNDLVLTVNANNTLARSMIVRVIRFDNGLTNDVPFNQTYTFTNGIGATDNFNITVAKELLAFNTQYLIELTTYDAPVNGADIGQAYYDLFTEQNFSTPTPTISTPANGTTSVSVNPTISVPAYQGCNNLTNVTIELAPGSPESPAQWGGAGSQIVQYPSSNGPFNWQPATLAFGTAYQVRVTFTNNTGNYTAISNFTTATQLPVQPVLNSPITTFNNRFNLCNELILNVNPNDVNARSLVVRVTRFNNGLTNDMPFDRIYPLANGTVATTPFNINIAQELIATLPGDSIKHNVQYLIELRTRNSNQVTLGQSYTDLFTGPDLTNAVANTPVITSPTQGATVSSLSPAITVNPFSSGCGTLLDITYEVNLASSAGWSSSNYQTAVLSAGSYTWTVPIALTAGETYKARVTFRINKNGRITNYPSDVVTFIISPFSTFLDLTETGLATPSKTVEGLLYLNSRVQTLRVTPVSDPRVFQYEIQLSSTPDFANVHYSAVSPTNTFVFNANAQQLESSTLYYVRARVRYNNGGTPTDAPWSSAANVRSLVNSLHPTFVDRPVGNITNNSTRLRGWHMKNATNMFFQIATDAGFMNLVNAAGPYGPLAADPASGQIAYERYSYRRWVGGSLAYVPLATVNDGFLPFNTLGEYDYVRYLVPGQTYYMRVKNVRQAANGVYLQEGYWGDVTFFTVPAATRTHSIGLGGLPDNVPVNTTAYVNTAPANWFSIKQFQLEISSNPGFTSIVHTQFYVDGGPGVPLGITLNYNTTYYMRVRTQAFNDPLGDNNWSAWSPTLTFKTMLPPGSRSSVAAAAMSEDRLLAYSVAFPNPFAEDVAVSLKSDYQAVTVTLINQNGKVVDKVESFGGNTIVLGKKVSQGLYLIRITDKDGLRETLKVVKQ